MLRTVRGLIAQLHLKRFHGNWDIPVLAAQDRVFSSFSITWCSVILVMLAAVWYFALRTADVAISLIAQWVELFKLREIFRFSLFDTAFVGALYHVLVALVLALLSAKALSRILTYAFSVLVIFPDRLVIVESNLLRSRIHQIPYDRICRVSARETIAHRILKLGNLEIHTGERDAPLRFGPAPRFPSLISQLMVLAAKR